MSAAPSAETLAMIAAWRGAPRAGASNAIRESAHAYVANGWRVIACHTPDGKGGCSCRQDCGSSIGKHPRLEHGLKDCTTHPNAVDAWWKQWPTANVAVLTGEGLLVLDVDRRNGGDETLGALEAKHGALPMSHRVLTGNGWHIYLRAPCELRFRGTLGEGVDAKWNGGYVMAPPSLHLSGRHYEVDAGSEEIADAPQWVLDVLTRESGVERPALPGSDAADTFLGTAFAAAGWLGGPVGSGKRAARCPWFEAHTPVDGKRTGDGSDSSTVLMPPTTAARGGAFCCKHGHCDARTFGDVLRALPRHAVESARAKFPPQAPASPNRSASRRLGDVAREMAKAGAVVRLPTGIATLDEAMRGGFPTPRLVIWGGAPGAAKTSIVNFLANKWAREGIFVGLLAIDEGAEGSVMRLAQLAGHAATVLESGDPAAWGAVVAHLDALPILVSDDGSTIESFATEVRAAAGPDAPAVLIVDSIQTARAAGTELAEGPRARIDAVVRALKGVVREQRLLTHATCELARGSYRSKSVAEQINDLAAFKESGGIEYAAQTAFVLRNVPDEDDLFDVSVPKNRAHSKVPFRLRMDRRTASFVEVELPPVDGPSEGTSPRTSEGRRDQVEADAQAVIRVLVERPGIAGLRGLRDEVKARGLGIGNSRIGAAVARLGVLPESPTGRIQNRLERGKPRWFYRPEAGVETGPTDERNGDPWEA